MSQEGTLEGIKIANVGRGRADAVSCVHRDHGSGTENGRLWLKQEQKQKQQQVAVMVHYIMYRTVYDFVLVVKV